MRYHGGAKNTKSRGSEVKRSVATVLLLVAAGSLQAAEFPPAARLLPADCDRSCLYGFVDQYLDALKQKDAGGSPRKAKLSINDSDENSIHSGDGKKRPPPGLKDVIARLFG